MVANVVLSMDTGKAEGGLEVNGVHRKEILDLGRGIPHRTRACKSIAYLRREPLASAIAVQRMSADEAGHRVSVVNRAQTDWAFNIIRLRTRLAYSAVT